MIYSTRGRGGLELPDQPRPGAAVHRPRPSVRLVTDRTEAGYVVKHQDGRRNRCPIQAHAPLYETDSREQRRGAALAGQR